MPGSTSAVDTFRRVADESGLAWATTLAADRFLPISPLRLWRPRVVSIDALVSQVESVLASWGFVAEHIGHTAELVVYADAHGIDSHGCGMLPGYERDLRTGVLTAAPEISIVSDGPTTALLDAGGGLGHVPASRAMAVAIEKASDEGVGIVGVRNSGHYGAAGAYAEMASDVGLVGIAMTNTRAPIVVPTRGAGPILGTNPIAFAAPAGRNEPFLLDMATSTVPIGRVITAWKEGRNIPAGWASAPNGRPTRNARLAALGRRLTPLGGNRVMGSHKGYGLGAMVEILTSSLTGVRFPRLDPSNPGQIGHFLMAIDPGRFVGGDAFRDGVDDLIESLKDVPPRDPERPVLVAGDPERAAFASRTESGIPLSRSVYEDIRGVAIRAGIDFTI